MHADSLGGVILTHLVSFKPTKMATTAAVVLAALASARPASVETIRPPPSIPAFRFASSQGDGMVLQQAPARATVWGFVPAGQKVSVTFNGQTVAAATGEWLGNNTFLAKLPATPASLTTTYNITATSNGDTITLANVLFGDVWVCSGQSNMEYPLGPPSCWNASNVDCAVSDAQCNYGCVNNSAAEVAAMANYPNLRLYQNSAGGSKVPLPESGNSGWKTPAEFGYSFSAMCWFFGRNLYDALSTKVPIGLVQTNVGGTPDEHWSSPDALAKCKASAVGNQSWAWPDNFTDSVLWNGKVVPLTRNTIKGAVWMQGEANARGDGRQYNCSFPAMIQDWRAKWSAGTGGTTSESFPFGWAQLNSDGLATDWVSGGQSPGAPHFRFPVPDDPLLTWHFGFSSIRLAESNTLSLPNTFQAVILDTPVASGSVHSPYKQAAGSRLARGALDVAYGAPQPYPVVASVAQSGGAVTVTVGGMGAGSIEVRAKLGFEVRSGTTGLWTTPPITGSTSNSVSLAAVDNATHVRYLYRSAPCGNYSYACPIYIPVKPLGSLSGELDFYPLGPFFAEL